MTPFFKKFLGITLIVVAIFGMIFSSVGVYSVWAIRSAVIRSLDDMVELFEITLDTTEAGLNVLDQSLGATTDTLDSTLATTTGIAQTLNDISGLIGGIADIASMFGAEVDTPASDDEALSTNVQEMADDLSDITTSLNEAQEVIDRYQVNVDQAQAQLENFRENGPMWITAFAVIMTIILVWLAIAQIGLLLQGWAMVRPEQLPANPPENTA
jgi:methyl-accepting chemotaxis protein